MDRDLIVDDQFAANGTCDDSSAGITGARKRSIFHEDQMSSGKMRRAVGDRLKDFTVGFVTAPATSAASATPATSTTTPLLESDCPDQATRKEQAGQYKFSEIFPSASYSSSHGSDNAFGAFWDTIKNDPKAHAPCIAAFALQAQELAVVKSKLADIMSRLDKLEQKFKQKTPCTQIV